MRREMLPPLVFLPLLCYADTSIKKTGVDRMAEQEMLLDTATIKAAVAAKFGGLEPVSRGYGGALDDTQLGAVKRLFGV